MHEIGYTYCTMLHSDHIDTHRYFVEEKQADVNQPDILLETPLTYASFAGNAEIVSYLVQRGATSNPTTLAGNRARHAASADIHCRWVLVWGGGGE